MGSQSPALSCHESGFALRERIALVLSFAQTAAFALVGRGDHDRVAEPAHQLRGSGLDFGPADFAVHFGNAGERSGNRLVFGFEKIGGASGFVFSGIDGDAFVRSWSIGGSGHSVVGVVPNQKAATGMAGSGAGGNRPTAIVFALRHLAHAQLASGSFAVLRVGLSFFRYLQWMALPIHMSVERSTDLPADNYSLAAVTAIAGLLLLIGSMLYWRDKLAPLSFGALWLVLLLVPFCGLLPNYQGLAERYEYLSSMGLVIAAGALVRNASRAARPFAIVIATAWFLWGSWRVDARSLDWKDELTIDRASLAASPNSAVLLYNIAIAETATGDVSGAIADYGRAITANSRYEPAFVNLANLLRQQGDLQEAVGVLRRAIALNANDGDAWTAIGNVYQQMRSFDEARDAYAKAVALNPADARAVANLGAALEQSGDLDGAKRQYKHAISLDPGQGSAYCNLSMVLFQQGKMDDAIGILKQAIARDDRYTPAYFDLGVLYEQADNRAAAVEMYKKVLALDRAYPKARDRLNSLLR